MLPNTHTHTHMHTYTRTHAHAHAYTHTNTSVLQLRTDRTIMKLPVISGSVATSISVIAKSSQVILVPLSSDVIGADAVVVTNVALDSLPMTVTAKSPRDGFPGVDNSTKADNPLYLQRATAAEILQVKVTVVLLHTSGPASLDRSTAAEAEGMMMASIMYFYSIKHQYR